MELIRNLEKKFQKILFVDPFGDDETKGLNIGIAYLSSVLRNINKTVSVLDLVNIFNGKPEGEIRKAILNFKPEIVGFSIQNLSFKFSKKLISFLRTIYSGHILIGGPEITARKKSILNGIPEADIALIGEGENTLPDLLRHMEEGNDISNVDGIVWRQENKIFLIKKEN